MDGDFLKHAFIFAIPIIAIVGGITMGIIRTLGEQRMAELARRERIAAIERGVDPERLPPIADPNGRDEYAQGSGRLRRAHGLMIGGSILVAIGIATFALLASIEPDKSHKLLGLLPLLTGCALLASSAVIWPRKK